MKYEGFSEATKVRIISCAALIALLNLGMAWFVANKAMNQIPMSEKEIDGIIKLTLCTKSSSNMAQGKLPVTFFMAISL